jgi:hypothetical protein
VYVLPAPTPLYGDPKLVQPSSGGSYFPPWSPEIIATNPIQGPWLADQSYQNPAFAALETQYSLEFNGEPQSGYDLVSHGWRSRAAHPGSVERTELAGSS